MTPFTTSGPRRMTHHRGGKSRSAAYHDEADMEHSYGPPAKVRSRFSMATWAKRPEVAQAWRELATQHNLVDKELRDVDRVFAFLDGMICRPAPLNFR